MWSFLWSQQSHFTNCFACRTKFQFVLLALVDVTLFSFCPFNTTSFKIEIQVGSTSVLDYYYLSGLVAQKFISFRGPCIFLLLLSVLVKLSILCCNQLDAPVIENFISTRAILCVHVDLSNLAFVDDFFAFAVTEMLFCDHHVLL